MSPLCRNTGFVAAMPAWFVHYRAYGILVLLLLPWLPSGFFWPLLLIHGCLYMRLGKDCWSMALQSFRRVRMIMLALLFGTVAGVVGMGLALVSSGQLLLQQLVLLLLVVSTVHLLFYDTVSGERLRIIQRGLYLRPERCLRMQHFFSNVLAVIEATREVQDVCSGWRSRPDFLASVMVYLWP